VPIACTLTPDDASDRIEEWRQFLSASVGTAIRTSREQLQIRLNPSTKDLIIAVDLAQRERACCEFLQVSIKLGADARWLVIGVPPDAIALLDDFEALLPDV
jgi:hypothetical protein